MNDSESRIPNGEAKLHDPPGRQAGDPETRCDPLSSWVTPDET